VGFNKWDFASSDFFPNSWELGFKFLLWPLNLSSLIVESSRHVEKI
jgi:hypothetical protein